jgi:hypothetical protein
MNFTGNKIKLHGRHSLSSNANCNSSDVEISLQFYGITIFTATGYWSLS